jgi:hypothetical protein
MSENEDECTFNNMYDIATPVLEGMGFKIFKITPDGNCFFRALEKYFINITQNLDNDHTSIRQEVCKKMKDCELLQTIYGEELKNLIEPLFEDGMYECDIADFLPYVVSQIYKIKVIVHKFEDGIYFDSDSFTPEEDMNKHKPLYLLYSNEVHYDLLEQC